MAHLDGNWLLINAEHTKAKKKKEIFISNEIIPIWKEMKSRFDTTKYKPGISLTATIKNSSKLAEALAGLPLP